MAEYSACTFAVEAESVSDPAEVLRRVTAQVGDGWVCYASGLVARRGDEQFTTGSGAHGIPLAGEWRVDDKRSVHLRQRGTGWVWTTMTERSGGDRRVEQTFLGTARLSGTPKLRYHTLWRRAALPDTAGDVRPWAPAISRFVGWED